MRLLGEVGAFCLEYQDAAFRNLNCRRIQVDEMWSFVYAKEKNVTPTIAAKVQSGGDAWLWVAIDADTKLVRCWSIGNVTPLPLTTFIEDLAGRLRHRILLTSDGLKLYLEAVDYAFSGMVDYAMLVKIYGKPEGEEKRYSPATCIGCQTHHISGNPDRDHINTSYVERQNLSVRGKPASGGRKDRRRSSR